MRFQKFKVSFLYKGVKYEYEVEREFCRFEVDSEYWTVWFVVESTPRHVFQLCGNLDEWGCPTTDNLVAFDYEAGNQYDIEDRKAKIGDIHVYDCVEYRPLVTKCPLCGAEQVVQVEDFGRYYCNKCRTYFEAKTL